MLRKVLITTFIFCLIGSGGNAKASGIQVSPSFLDFNEFEDISSGELIVVNPNSEIQVFKVYSDNLGLSFEPTDFILEAGGRKVVVVNANFKLMDRQKSFLDGEISVVGSARKASDLSVATGVKVKYKIEKYARKGFGPSQVASVFVIALSVLFIVYTWTNRRRR